MSFEQLLFAFTIGALVRHLFPPGREHRALASVAVIVLLFCLVLLTR